MSAPFTLGDTLRVHDKSVYDWLAGITVDYNNIAGVTRNAFPILRIFASPDRAFAQVEDLLVRTGWINGLTPPEQRENAEENWAVLPLPVCTIERDLPINSDQTNNVAAAMQHVYFDRVNGVYQIYAMPARYLTTYHITFWCLKRYTQAFITEWLMAQLGNLGRGYSEVMLTVNQPAPFGPIGQGLKYNSSQDLTQLEGHEPRWIRFQFDFTLNTLMFRPPLYTAPLARNLALNVELPDPSLVADTDPSAVQAVTLPAQTQSRNLFFDITNNIAARIATDWPVIGNATVARSTRYPGGILSPAPPLKPLPFGMRCVVKDTTDAVSILEAVSTLDGNNQCIVCVSVNYSTAAQAAPPNQAFALTVQSRNAANEALTLARSVSFPESKQWTRVTMFALTNFQTFLVQLAGIGSSLAEGVVITDILVRVVYGGVQIPYQQAQPNVPTSGVTSYRWASLANVPYLVVGVLGAAVAGTVYADDDIQTPDFTASQAVQAAQLGFVLLVQPKAGTIQVRAPSAMALAALYVQRYSGSDDENLA